MLETVLTHCVCDSEDVDGDNHYPSANAIVGMNAISGIEHTHEKHASED